MGHPNLKKNCLLLIKENYLLFSQYILLRKCKAQHNL